jgi:N-acetylglucosaminyldiphosphoundecaprenol N-acetyl-beta-D-mannosaminyltransferase
MKIDEIDVGSAKMVSVFEDLSREVYCVLGVPVDAVGMDAVLRRIQSAATSKIPFLISTPNLNFLVTSQLDRDFRETLVMSDLCTADGMPIVWIALLSGFPIKTRVAGSDIFDMLKTEHRRADPLKIFFFGGAEGVAAAASRVVNGRPGGIYCVGSLYPGFCSVEEMSRDEIINSINASGADLLVVSLGAQKGQLWLQRNHHRLTVPLRAHLGASINFEAGTVRRAPRILRKLGLEWLWRIKEEPHLWRRYWNDGRALALLLFTRLIPLLLWTRWLQLGALRQAEDLTVIEIHNDGAVTLSLCGFANARNVEKAIAVFRRAIATSRQITLDFSKTRVIDARFLGLLLMLKKNVRCLGSTVGFVGLSPCLQRIFRLNRLEFEEVDRDFMLVSGARRAA